MILEHAILTLKPGTSNAFEKAFREAQVIISSQKGYIKHEIHKCLEVTDQYLLLVWWETLEDHEPSFRSSENYQKWKKLLHHFYVPFPTVQHYQIIV